jgi:putative endonuclease
VSRRVQQRLRSAWRRCLAAVRRHPWFRPAHLRLGQRGEQLAARYLRRQGYRLLHRNVDFVVGELDLVILHGQTVVFVEVKTRRVRQPRGPAAAVTRAKQLRICRAARRYLAQHRLTDCAVRFDVVGIVWPQGAKPELEHHLNAFPWRRARPLTTPLIPSGQRSGGATRWPRLD